MSHARKPSVVGAQPPPFFRTSSFRVRPFLESSAHHRPFTNQQAYFERSLSVWAAARAKHQRQLRPAFGSADRRDELDELLAIEAARAAEVTEAIVSFSRELLKEEVAAMKAHAAKIACCFGGVAAILDRYVSSVLQSTHAPFSHDGSDETRPIPSRLEMTQNGTCATLGAKMDEASAHAHPYPPK